MIKYSDLSERLLIEWFPELTSSIHSEMELSHNLPHCLYSDVINPVIKGLLSKTHASDSDLLERFFSFFEYLATNGDDEVCNLLQVSLLENLWDDYVTYNRSIAMMGEKTKIINKEIGQYMRIPVPKK